MGAPAYKADQITEAITAAMHTDESVFVRYNKRNYVPTLVALGAAEDLVDVSVNSHTKLIELTRKEA